MIAYQLAYEVKMSGAGSITLLDRKLNDFARRSFRDEADHDYIAARMAYRAGLLSQFLWSSLQAIEKYCKYMLIVNRVPAPRKNLGHDIERALLMVRQKTPCKVNFVDPRSERFVQLLNTVGSNRYLEVSQYSMTDHLEVLDSTVWSIRRFCTVLSYLSPHGKDMLPIGLRKIAAAEGRPHHEFKLMSGRLEAILAAPDRPEGEALLWQNAEYNENGAGPVRNVRSSFANAPLYMHPEIVDEVLRYAYIPSRLADEYRAYAKEVAAQKAEKG